MGGALAAIFSATAGKPGPTSITVGVWNVVVDKVGTFYCSGFDKTGAFSASGSPEGSLSPIGTFGGATINAFGWSGGNGNSGYTGSHTLTLELAGDTHTSVPTVNASVNGTGLGVSGSGSYDGSTQTTYTWTCTNPFGTTNGASMSMGLS